MRKGTVHSIWVTCLILVMTLGVKAQQVPHYTQYMFNPLNYNPAYAGNKAILSAALIYRNQWTGIEGAPKIVTASVHSPLKNKSMGAGFEISSDKIGPVNNLKVQATYAYRMRLSRISKGKLGFGLRAGIHRFDYNWDEIHYKESGDAISGVGRQNYTVPTFDFGVYYHKTNVTYSGIAFSNINSPKIGIGDEVQRTTDAAKLYSMVTLIYGRIIELNDRVVFRPSGLMRANFNSTPLLDINASFLFDQAIWVGVSYRTNSSVAAILEYEINEQFKIGYSYDYSFSNLGNYHSGSHEIFLGYNFNVFRSRMRSPRYYF